MPSVTYPIQPNGAVVWVLLELSDAGAQAIQTAGQPLSPPQQCKGFLHTGASHTTVERGYLRTLGAKPLNGQSYLAMGSTQATWGRRYRVKLTLLLLPTGQLGPYELDVLEADLMLSGCHVAVGRDFMAHFAFGYDGLKNEFTISW